MTTANTDVQGEAQGEARRLASYVETWHRACADFVALVRTIPEELGDRPTDLAGWSVRDNVAHVAHLESVLVGGPEADVEVPPSAHVRGPLGHYTEQGVLARRDRTMAALAEEIEQAVAIRYAELRADPPTDPRGRPARLFVGVDWDNDRFLRNRPLDVWMHEQDIRRALDRPGGYDSPAAAHTIDYLLGSLGVVVGKRVAPSTGTSVVVAVPEAGLERAVVVGEDGRAANADVERIGEPTTRITLTPESFVVVAGGRRAPTAAPAVEGDAELAERVLASMAVTP